MTEHTVMENPEQVVTIGYTNYRGEVSLRKIIPKQFEWGRNDYYPTPQFLIEAYDLEKRDHRTFALNNIFYWKDENAIKSAQKPFLPETVAAQAVRTLFP